MLFDPCVLSVAKEFGVLLLLSVPGVGVVVNLSAVVPVPVIPISNKYINVSIFICSVICNGYFLTYQ